MIRNFLTITRQGIRMPVYKHQAPLMFVPKSYFASSDEVNKYAELKHLSKILATPYFRFNDELSASGEVRLLDAGNKLIGIYGLSDAKKKCQQLGLDIVMTNSASRPPICKAYNYREDLYKKFVKEVLEKDMPKLSKARQRVGQTKTVKLGARMTNADLNTKVELAKEMAKRVKTVRIYMRVSEDDEESGRNIIFTFRDLVKEFLKPRGEIEEREVYEDEEETFKEGKKNDAEEEGEEKALVQEFQSLLNAGPGELRAMTEVEIKEMIQTYVQREVRKKTMGDEIDLLVKSNDPDVRALKETEEDEDEDELAIFDLRKNIENVEVEEEPEDAAFDNLMNKLKRQKEDPKAARLLNEEIDELRSRFGGSRAEGLADHILEQQQKRLQAAVRLARFKKLYENRRDL